MAEKRVLVVIEKHRFEMPLLPGDTKESAIRWFTDTARQAYLTEIYDTTYEVVEVDDEKEVTP